MSESEPASPPLTLAVAGVLALVAALAPVVNWEGAAPSVALPVFHAGSLGDRALEGFDTVTYGILGALALGGMLLPRGRSVLAFGLLVAMMGADFVHGIGRLLLDVSSGFDGAWLASTLGAGTWSLLSSAALATLTFLAGARSVRPLGVAGTVVGLLALLPALVPSAVVGDLFYGLADGDLERLLDPWRLAASLLRPIVILAALPMFLRLPALAWWGAAWPVAFALSLPLGSVLRAAGYDDPVWWVIPVSAIAMVLGSLLPAALGRAWAVAEAPPAA